jgi:hypothetical protein
MVVVRCKIIALVNTCSRTRRFKKKPGNPGRVTGLPRLLEDAGAAMRPAPNDLTFGRSLISKKEPPVWAPEFAMTDIAAHCWVPAA